MARWKTFDRLPILHPAFDRALSPGACVPRWQTPVMLILLSCVLSCGRQSDLAEAPQKANLAEAEQAAGAMWTGFQSVAWDTQPEGRCAESGGEGSYWRFAEEWSYRCSEKRGLLEEQRFYYAFHPDAPALRLEQYRAFLEHSSEEWLRKVYGLLAGRLDRLFGSGAFPESYFFVRPPGRWSHLLSWHSGDHLIYLSIDRNPEGNPKLTLLVCHHHLLEAQNAEEIAERTIRKYHDPTGGTALDRRLADALGTLFPDLPKRLERGAHDRAAAAENAALLLDLLNKQTTVPAQLRPALLLAADRLVDRLGALEESSPEWDALSRNLGDYGLTFKYSPLGSDWVYQHDLLRVLLQAHAESEWAPEAFLALMDHGFDTSDSCREGSDSFRRVIRHAQDFLRRHPNSPVEPFIWFGLAQAYETWWSLSKASDSDPYVDRSEYQQGAEAARAEAIKAYEKVRILAPDSAESSYAALRLPRLKLGLDTKQRRFFCIYD